LPLSNSSLKQPFLPFSRPPSSPLPSGRRSPPLQAYQRLRSRHDRRTCPKQARRKGCPFRPLRHAHLKIPRRNSQFLPNDRKQQPRHHLRQVSRSFGRQHRRDGSERGEGTPHPWVDLAGYQEGVAREDRYQATSGAVQVVGGGRDVGAVFEVAAGSDFASLVQLPLEGGELGTSVRPSLLLLLPLSHTRKGCC
jgi:hypothetical protein